MNNEDKIIALLEKQGAALEKQGELLGALLSGDQKTFELFRTEAPELRHLPAATYEWYSKNYLDRDYPLRFILMCNGVEFPDTPEEDK